jgi:hypothetical protein
MSERTHYRAKEAKPGCTVGGSSARVASAVCAMKASVVIWRHRRRGQRDGDGRGQVPRPGSCNLCAALGVQSEVFTLSNLYAFQASFDFLFNPIGWNDLMKHNTKLPVAI